MIHLSGKLMSWLCIFMFVAPFTLHQHLPRYTASELSQMKELSRSRPPTIVYEVDVSKEDLACLEQVIWHEARGEPIMGQVAVAQVVLNRVWSERYPSSICGVVYDPDQFTGISKAKKYKVDKQIKDVAHHVTQGHIDWIVKDATMYYSPEGMKKMGKTKPSWNWKKLRFVGVLAGHKFYREV